MKTDIRMEKQNKMESKMAIYQKTDILPTEQQMASKTESMKPMVMERRKCKSRIISMFVITSM